MTNFTVNVMLKFEVELLRPDLSGNPFYATKWSEKIGSGSRIKSPKSIPQKTDICHLF